MATDKEVLQLWNSVLKNKKQDEAIVELYRLAENSGKKAGLLAMEKEMLKDETIEKALNTFGIGRRSKSGVITMRAILRGVTGIALEAAKKRTETI